MLQWRLAGVQGTGMAVEKRCKKGQRGRPLQTKFKDEKQKAVITLPLLFLVQYNLEDWSPCWDVGYARYDNIGIKYFFFLYTFCDTWLM